MYLISTLKKQAILLLLFVTVFSCKKQKPDVDPVPPKPNETPSIYQSIYSTPTVSFCGSALTSTLKIQDGTDIGTVTVSNDAVYLYLTYTLIGNWYLGEVHSYAGRESLIPRNIEGNPNYKQFPGKQSLDFCDLRQNFTFRVSLSDLTIDNNSQCPTNEQYYIAMRASVKQFNSGAECAGGAEQPAWGAPFLINPGNANEWATAFYYCKQDCSVPAFCAYSQGYWFMNPNPNAGWCQIVKFGSLQINELQGDSLWPAQNNWIKKALFQSSAIQLSMKCANGGIPVPGSIVNDYNRLEAFLSTLTYDDIKNETFPASTDTTGVRAATGNIGRWICNNHCSANPDPNACTGY
jgi:hypothetical protein